MGRMTRGVPGRPQEHACRHVALPEGAWAHRTTGCPGPLPGRGEPRPEQPVPAGTDNGDITPFHGSSLSDYFRQDKQAVAAEQARRRSWFISGTRAFVGNLPDEVGDTGRLVPSWTLMNQSTIVVLPEKRLFDDQLLAEEMQIAQLSPAPGQHVPSCDRLRGQIPARYESACRARVA